MINKLICHKQGQTLILYGELNYRTLLTIWQQRQPLLDGIQFLDVSNLKHIDSAGVALILHFHHYQKIRGTTLIVTGVNNKLRTLITLYKLQAILPCTTNTTL